GEYLPGSLQGKISSDGCLKKEQMVVSAIASTPQDSAIAALKTPVADSEADKETAAAALDKTNRGLKNSLNNVLTVRAELGTQLNELESLDSLGSDRALGQTQQMSDLVDVDWNATISSYIMQQTALQASYKAFTDMQGLSLFQLNK
ncbi:hypothetical protein NEL70_04275, partial [Escherichia coli]|nr:hypothetical protein [Escherichia coli]